MVKKGLICLFLIGIIEIGISGCAHQHWGTVDEVLTLTKDEVRHCLTVWPEFHAAIKGAMQGDYDTKLTAEMQALMIKLDEYARKEQDGSIADIDLMYVAGLKGYIFWNQLWPIVEQYLPGAMTAFKTLF